MTHAWRWRVGGGVLLAIAALMLIGALLIASMPGGPAARCVHAGPELALTPRERAAWEPLEAIRTTGSVSILPLGRSCTYASADGSRTRTVSPGWDTTVAVAIPLLGAFGCFAVAARRGRGSRVLRIEP